MAKKINLKKILKFQPLFLPLSIFLGGVVVAVSIVATGGLGRISTTADDLLPTGDSGGEVQVSVDDNPALGDANAPITVVEFSDFQCPFCRSFWAETLPKIKSEYIDKGLVRFVYRDLPLTQLGHTMAQPYAEAAHCAGDQDKFWEMHDQIFEEQERIFQENKKEDPFASATIFGVTESDVKSWAGELGLDRTAFDSCLDSGKYAEEVAKDVADAQNYNANGTPTFFVGRTDPSGTFTGQVISGAQPFASFQLVIDALLE